jgi:hypothetical protein
MKEKPIFNKIMFIVASTIITLIIAVLLCLLQYNRTSHVTNLFSIILVSLFEVPLWTVVLAYLAEIKLNMKKYKKIEKFDLIFVLIFFSAILCFYSFMLWKILDKNIILGIAAIVFFSIPLLLFVFYNEKR